MKRYDVSSEVITGRVMKQAMGNCRKHENLRTYQILSGIEDDNDVEREMKNIYSKHLPSKLKVLLPTNPHELTSNIIDGSAPVDSISKEYKENMLCCSHAIKILRIFRIKDFMRLHNENAPYERVDRNLIKSYIDNNWREITTILHLSTEKHEAYKDRRGSHGNYIDKAAAKLLDKSFGMSYSSSSDEVRISNGIFKNVNGKIVLRCIDSTKILPSRDYVLECFRRNVINAPQQRALVLNIIRNKEDTKE